MIDFDKTKIDYLIDFICSSSVESFSRVDRHFLENASQYDNVKPTIGRGVSKITFIFDDVTVKVGRKKSIDICSVEFNNYLLAKEKGIEQFFPETELYKEKDGIKFYIQETVNHDKNYLIKKFKESADEEYLKKEQYDNRRFNRSIHSIIDCMTDDERVRNLMCDYEKDEVEKLISFIHDHHISDLRRSNFGYRFDNDKCVIFDFCGLAV